MNSGPKILVVDDERGMCELLEIVLSNDGFQVDTVGNVKDACAALERASYDAVVTDLRFGSDRNGGMNVLAWIQQNNPSLPSIMMTAHGSVETAIEALKRGAADYIIKPFKNDEIRLVIRRALEKRDLTRENFAFRKEQAKRGSLQNMIGNSPQIEEVKDMIRRVAGLPSTIAIYGESGTGKELVARGIHQFSDRAAKPFVAINCGGIPENLLESELFGHKKGAFTGAFADKEGLFAMANGGTLFLDEIGELPLQLQVKLLRVLDNDEVMPVGGTVPRRVDVRLISATNRNLEGMAAAGTFREDLYYRLNVIPVRVPSLRERSGDIPLLARHFCKAHAEKMGRRPLEIGVAAMNALTAYPWPGNVRELENVMERAVALCAADSIDSVDLPPHVRNFVSKPEKSATELPPGGLDLEAHIAEIETRLITEALDRARHSQKKAAQLLGLTPRSLRYRLRKYGLDAD